MDAVEQFEAYLATNPEFCLVYFSQTDYPILVIASDDTRHTASELRLACYEQHFKYFHQHPTGNKFFDLNNAKAYHPDEFDRETAELSEVVRL